MRSFREEWRPAAPGGIDRRRGGPEVTVVIPTRNRSGLLPTGLASALAQVDVDLEVIVVDDASTDDTPDVLAAVDDPRLHVIRFATHSGVTRARNAGLGAARGSWVAFLDDDDIWAPWKLRWQLDAAGQSTANAFVYGAAVTIDDSHGIIRYGTPPDPATLATSLLVSNVIPGGCSNVIARTTLAQRLGGFDERLSQLGDRDLWIRMAHAGEPIACPYIVVAYRSHLGNMRYQRPADGIEELEYLMEKHRELRQEHGIVAGRGRRAGYRYFARGQRGAGHRLQAARIFAHLGIKERGLSDLARAVGALVLGRGTSDPRGRSRRRARWATTSEIEWLRARSPQELEWLHTLTLRGVDGEPRTDAPLSAKLA
jgi:glycosyltransferase involved in cell wall biosynthesis